MGKVTIYTKERGKEVLDDDEWVDLILNKTSTLHRNDGPALEFEDGSSHYYFEGKRFPAEFWMRLNLMHKIGIG